jgi:hypothetical protein
VTLILLGFCLYLQSFSLLCVSLSSPSFSRVFPISFPLTFPKFLLLPLFPSLPPLPSLPTCQLKSQIVSIPTYLQTETAKKRLRLKKRENGWSSRNVFRSGTVSIQRHKSQRLSLKKQWNRYLCGGVDLRFWRTKVGCWIFNKGSKVVT